jgi:hypothetical protein
MWRGTRFLHRFQGANGFGWWSRGIAALNPWLGSGIPSGCLSRPSGPRATLDGSPGVSPYRLCGRAARVPIEGGGAPAALPGWAIQRNRCAVNALVIWCP